MKYTVLVNIGKQCKLSITKWEYERSQEAYEEGWGGGRGLSSQFNILKMYLKRYPNDAKNYSLCFF